MFETLSMLKIADTQEELEACFRLLHDAYVASGLQKPDPSGMRATIYHALPTTTTLCATHEGEVVATMSLIRENAFGFPMQSIFDLQSVRIKGGNIAEVSAFAVHPKYRRTGGAILFPLMKFMYEYCTNFFDTQHLIIAVNPDSIEMYESLLFFERLSEKKVDKYDFVNGAPAVGATLNLEIAPEMFKQIHGRRKQKRNLHTYFTELTLPDMRLPSRRYYTTNDPVMTPELLDYFFNQQTKVFANLDERKKVLLHSIYDTPAYSHVLPKLDQSTYQQHPLRQHQRYSLKCPGTLRSSATEMGELKAHPFEVCEVSMYGFQAASHSALPLNTWCDVTVQLGRHEKSRVRAMALRKGVDGVKGRYAFKIEQPDEKWSRLVNALQWGQTHEDLQDSRVFDTQEVAGNFSDTRSFDKRTSSRPSLLVN